MNTKLSRLAIRTSLATLAVGALIAPALVISPSEAAPAPQLRKVHKHTKAQKAHKSKKSTRKSTRAKSKKANKSKKASTTGPQTRTVSAPNVFFPVAGGRSVGDLKSFSKSHLGTDLVAPCGSPVVATHAGTVEIETSTRWANPYVVRVATQKGGLVTSAAYLASVTVQDGQIIAPGQQIGTVGARSNKEGCRTYFSVNNGGSWENPSAWLNSYVGKPAPVGSIFGDPGFTIASFNVLGASHTKNGGTYPVASVRMPQAYNVLQAYNVDVAGLQEFQDGQKAQFLDLANGEFGVYNFKGPRGKEDTDNAIIWRKSAFQFVSGDTFDVPYFNGNIRHMPVVLLRSKATGRTAYFLNTHNAANVRGPAQKWRDQAIQIERQLIVDLRKTGRAVFITGDFNDKQNAFCPMTEGMLTFSPNSVPSMTCAYPKQGSIDWIFAAGPTRFSYFNRDMFPRTNKISDHPIVVARAHLQY